MIPGARGCTPQTCAFRDLHKVMIAAGAARVFGLSTQDTAYQKEAAERMHLPFPLLSDDKLALAKALRLPMMQVADMTLIKRLALVIDDGRITQGVLSRLPAGPERGRRARLARAEPALMQRARRRLADDGGAAHLKRGVRLPDSACRQRRAASVNLAKIAGMAIVYVYPWTGRPGSPQSAGLGRHRGRARLDAGGGRLSRSLRRLPAGRHRRVRHLHAVDRLSERARRSAEIAFRAGQRRSVRPAARAGATHVRDGRCHLSQTPDACGEGRAASSASTIPLRFRERTRANCARGSA